MSEKQRKLAEEYSGLRAKKEVLEAELTAINKRLKGSPDEGIASLEEEIVEYMTDSNLKTVKFDDLGTITLLAPSPKASYKKENEAEVFSYVISHGGEATIKQTIHPSTFASFIKEKLEGGEALPPFIDVYYQTALRFTKSGK